MEEFKTKLTFDVSQLAPPISPLRIPGFPAKSITSAIANLKVGKFPVTDWILLHQYFFSTLNRSWLIKAMISGFLYAKILDNREMKISYSEEC